jgi:cysteine desulfurase
VLGLLAGRTRAGRHLLAAAVEHSSVHHAGNWFAVNGGSWETAGVDRLGRVDLAAITSAVTGSDDQRPTVLAVQHANHEVGTIQPVTEAAAAAGDVPLFMDACASMGRLPLPPGWAAAAGSAHKWGGPAGVGVLVVRKGTRWRNPYPGDDRVDERTTGFENVPAALAAAAALQAMTADSALAARQHGLVARIRSRVAEVPDVEVVGDPDARLPHLVTFSCLYVDGEALVTELDRLGFGVASGSACTASTLAPSHVLEAMGVLTHGNVRVSLARDTTSAEVDAFLAALPEVVRRIRAEVGL